MDAVRCMMLAPVTDSITASTDTSPSRRPNLASASRSGATTPTSAN